MENKKYVAYVGTYTHGSSKGLQVYDVDVEKGTLTERSEVEVGILLTQPSPRTVFFSILLKMKALLYSDATKTVIWRESTA